MRSERTSGIPSLAEILPASCADWIGESGGTYQTMGNVRYSGWSGKAIFHFIAIFQMGDFVAAMKSPIWKMAMKDRKSTRLNSSHVATSYAVFCLEKKIYSTH